jgi:prepilin-type processing-associated H-X9-DG protein
MRHDNETGFFCFADGHVSRMKQSNFGKKNAKGEFDTDFSRWYWL